MTVIRRMVLMLCALVLVLPMAAASMTTTVYEQSRAVERVINGLQVLSERRGYSAAQQARVDAVRAELEALAYELIAEVEASGAPLADHEKARALQRALSVMILTADIGGFTDTQATRVAQIRGIALEIVREIRGEIGELQ